MRTAPAFPDEAIRRGALRAQKKKGRHTPAGIGETHVCRQSKRIYFSSFTALERGSITLTT